MPVMVQIRNVPDDLHRALKVRAAQDGLSLSDYILRELRKGLAYPTRAELLARLEALPPIENLPPAADLVREERDRE